MPADVEDLERRLAAATPRDTVRGLIFNATFALVRELAGEPAARDADPLASGRRHEYFSYPVADYLRAAWAAVAAIEARLGPADRAFREIGARCAARWMGSPLGRTLALVIGAEPRRLLASTPIGYRNVVSYGARSVEWAGERHARLVFEHDFLVADFHCGVLARAVHDLGHTAVRVEGREVAFLTTVYDVTW